MGIFSCFGNITRNESIITLFEEKQNRNGVDQTVHSDTVIVFVKLSEPPDYGDVTYFGHLQARKTSHFGDLWNLIQENLPDLIVRNVFSAYWEEPGHRLSYIANDELLLEECGIHSGSIIVLRQREPSEIFPVQDVQWEMPFVHNADSEQSEATSFEFSDSGSDITYVADPIGPVAARSINSVLGTRGIRFRSTDVNSISVAAGTYAPSSPLGPSLNPQRGVPSRPNWKSLSLNAGASVASFLVRRVLNLRDFRRTPARPQFHWKFVSLGAGACALSFLLGRASNSHRAESQTSFTVSLLPASDPVAESAVHGQHSNHDRMQALLLLCQASLASFASGGATSPELMFSVKLRRDEN